MYLIEVIPIARGISKETLSYFSSRPISPGSLVTVPLRKRLASALVISSDDAVKAKAFIRSSDFTMKKVGKFKSEPFLSEAFMKAARANAEFATSSLGSVLHALVPKAILEAVSVVNLKKSVAVSGTVFDRLALQSDNDERFANYRSLIREEFARKHSVFFCVPTAEDVKFFAAELSKGIENYTRALYGFLPKKKLQAAWKEIATEEHPILTVATGMFFSLCREDIGAIIIENESSRFYKLPLRPYVDVRTFAEFFAKEMKVKFIVGDTLLRTETIYRFEQGEFSELAPLKFRSLSPAQSRVIDMSGYKKSAGGKFETVSLELGNLIQASHRRNERLFILATRRGLATHTVCGDCGTVVSCDRCSSPVILHRARAADGNQNFFFCHGCGRKRSAEERCVKCESWKLVALGVGLELVETEIRQKFPSVKIFRVDKDVATTAKHATKIVGDFYASPGTVLLGTEMALPYLYKKIENTAVASLDSLFSFPDFRIHERILHVLLKVRSLASSFCIVQTRIPGEHILDYALKGNLIDFYREEIAARQTFNYPPFVTLIKVSLAGARAVVAKEMEKLKDYFAPFSTEVFPAFLEESRGAFTMHGLVRLPSRSWVNPELLQKLLSLPPEFRVTVEPESLL